MRTKLQLWLNVTSPVSRKYLQAANWSYKKHASEANGRTNRAAQTYPHAHVERDDGDTDVLCGFSVHIRELQPGVVLLLPRTQSIPCYKRWDCGEGKVRGFMGRGNTVAGVLFPQNNSFHIVKKNIQRQLHCNKPQGRSDFYTISKMMGFGDLFQSTASIWL